MEIINSKTNSPKLHKVTDIRPAIKNENRVNIYIDNKFEFSLDIFQVVELGLKKDRALSDDEISELKNASEFGKLYQAALEWVLMRPRSSQEVREYLKTKKNKRSLENKKRELNKQKLKENPELKKRQADLKIHTKILPEITNDNIEKVFVRLLERGYIDDEKFATYYVENRFVKKGISAKRLKMELIKKGITNEIIEKILQLNSRNDEDEIAKIIQKKRARYDDQKLLQYLVRQGFNYDDAKSAVEKSSQPYD